MMTPHSNAPHGSLGDDDEATTTSIDADRNNSPSGEPFYLDGMLMI